MINVCIIQKILILGSFKNSINLKYWLPKLISSIFDLAIIQQVLNNFHFLYVLEVLWLDKMKLLWNLAFNISTYLLKSLVYVKVPKVQYILLKEQMKMLRVKVLEKLRKTRLVFSTKKMMYVDGCHNSTGIRYRS